MKITCLDLLPPFYHTDIGQPQKMSAVFQLLDFIIDGMIQSQTGFDQYKESDVSEVRVVNLLLDRTHSLKSTLELNYLTAYLEDKKAHLKQKLIFFSEKSHFKSYEKLSDFLKVHELIIIIGLVDQYIFITYFLSQFKIKNKLDYRAVAKKVGIDIKDARRIADYYESILSEVITNLITQISIDISNRKKSEKSLQIANKKAKEASRAKTEFLENMRHDIRTPLTGIIGFARLIQSETVNPKLKYYADNLVLATSALLDFQNEILDAVKVSANIEALTKEEFCLKQLVERVLDLVRPKAIIKNLELSLLIDPNLPQMIIGDSKRLFRIFLELVTNALKFTALGNIQIYLSEEKKESNELVLRCEISDTGIGIPDDKKEEVFIRFNRLSPSSDGVYEGVGLGLTVVKKYVMDLGGKIKVKSKLGFGTTFVCLIPVESANNATIKKPISPAAESLVPLFDHLQILLIEDHEMTSTVTKLMLEEIRCDIDIGNNGQSALEKLKERKYDLILMDLGLPDCDGFDLAKKIREENSSVPLVVLTAHQDLENKLNYSSVGIDAVFQKPFLKVDAIKLFNTYFSEKKMKKKLIDLKLGAKRINKGESDAQMMLDLLIKNLFSDEKNIRYALDKKDKKKLQEANHKLLGGLSYCGAPRLEEACMNLQNALKNSDDSHCESCARIVLDVMQCMRSSY